MALFSQSQIDAINKVAEKSKSIAAPPTTKTSPKGMNSELNQMAEAVKEYFADSPAILISSKDQLHDYVDKCIECGWAGIDTETTGLDRIKDHIVGASLYYPGGAECYIPSKHLIPIFDEPYKNQLSYDEIQSEFQRLADNKVKLIFANADFDLAMIYKDIKVDLIDACYYDVILAWRCLKEDEKDNTLKGLYNKYVLRGKGDPKKFTDFFTPDLFPYCKPEIAKLYAANDAKITYELFKWQLPYVTKDHPKCKKAHLEAIADLVWNIEIPMIRVCQNLHRRGMYLDKEVSSRIHDKYTKIQHEEKKKLTDLVDNILETVNYSIRLKCPFKSGSDFNYNSSIHVPYLLKDIMGLDIGKSVDKNVLNDLNLPVTKQIIKMRNADKLISTYIDKLPNTTTSDSRIHARFNSIGASTGRMSSSEPNLQNIPSHAEDIRHMFRASPGYVIISSDYSSQEPRITAYVSGDKHMIKAFQDGKDIYGTIASVAFGLPYEKCLEFHPETHEYQPDGKARRTEAKSVVLGITYGRSVPSIAEQLYGTRTDMTDDEKTTQAQKVYDSVLNAFPDLRTAMLNAQNAARVQGYVETILGRRRHIPDMQLPEFEFKPIKGYVNPDVDPLDVSTLQDTRNEIPERIVHQLEQEFKGYKYFGQIARRTKELYEEEHIKVINNRPKIAEATRQCLNSVIQGSAADMSKMAMILLENNEEWQAIGGRFLLPVHDELIVEVPIDKAEEGSQILTSLMNKAGDFLPFPCACDATVTYRWYGLECPCPYEEPAQFENITDIYNMDAEHVKWIQYHLVDLEYTLPVFKEEDGSKPRGNAARGVNGKATKEMEDRIVEYMNRYRIHIGEFLSHIKRKVTQGD